MDTIIGAMHAGTRLARYVAQRSVQRTTNTTFGSCRAGRAKTAAEPYCRERLQRPSRDTVRDKLTVRRQTIADAMAATSFAPAHGGARAELPLGCQAQRTIAPEPAHGGACATLLPPNNGERACARSWRCPCQTTARLPYTGNGRACARS